MLFIQLDLVGGEALSQFFPVTGGYDTLGNNVLKLTPMTNKIFIMYSEKIYISVSAPPSVYDGTNC